MAQTDAAGGHRVTSNSLFVSFSFSDTLHTEMNHGAEAQELQFSSQVKIAQRVNSGSAV